MARFWIWGYCWDSSNNNQPSFWWRSLSYHSHNYTWIQEFKRSFDIGVLHSTEQWLIDTFGRAEGHGFGYLCSELAFLKRKKRLFLLPAYVIRNGLKFLGYTLSNKRKTIKSFDVKEISKPDFWNEHIRVPMGRMERLTKGLDPSLNAQLEEQNGICDH